MPLAFPNVGIQSINMRLRRSVAVTESPFTFNTQVFDLKGARWEAEISLPPLTHAEARSVEAFIVGLQGRSGTFTFGHPLHSLSVSATLSANAAVRDESLSSTGDAIPAGTYFQLGDYLYMITEDFSGSGSMSIQPPLRQAQSIGAVLDFTLPKSLWRMSANDIGWSTDTASMYGFSFACVEAL